LFVCLFVLFVSVLSVLCLSVCLSVCLPVHTSVCTGADFSYQTIALDDPLRLQLEDPDNCCLYKQGSKTHVYVGLKKVAKEVDRFVRQPADATQPKNLVYVVGGPKTGKTTEARVIVPQYLEKHIEQLAFRPAQLPCRRIFLDCSPLASLPTYHQKLFGFYERLALALVQPTGVRPSVATDKTVGERLVELWATVTSFLRLESSPPSHLSMVDIHRLLRQLTHYHIVTLDEYHMLFSSLNAEDAQLFANELRNLLLDEHHPVQFVVTGSTGAALINCLQLSIQNGISLFKGSAVLATDLDSDPASLKDVFTLLTHTNTISCPTPANAIKTELGFVNCAAVNIVACTRTHTHGTHDIRDTHDTPSRHATPPNHAPRAHTHTHTHTGFVEAGMDERKAVVEYTQRALDIYDRDYAAVIRGNSKFLSVLHHYMEGTDEPPPRQWRHFLVPYERSGKIFYKWKESLFTTYVYMVSEPNDDGSWRWADATVGTMPVYQLIPLVEWLIPFAEKDVDESLFAEWDRDWCKGTTADRDALILFLAYHKLAYWAREVSRRPGNRRALTNSSKNVAAWVCELQTFVPLRVLRECRNATVPHSKHPSGTAIKQGLDLMVAYYGRGDRSILVQYLKACYATF
jgi:hypothetical protein